jgi:hypothetical protein
MHKLSELWYSSAMARISTLLSKRIKPLARLFQPQQLGIMLLVWFVAFQAPVVCIIHCQLLHHSHAMHMHHAHMQHTISHTTTAQPAMVCSAKLHSPASPGLPPVSALPPVLVDVLPNAFAIVVPSVFLLGMALLLVATLPSLRIPPPTPPPRGVCAG